MIIGSTAFYTLISCNLPWPWFKVTGCEKSNTCDPVIIQNSESNWMDWIWGPSDLLVWWTSYSFYFVQSNSRERTLLMCFFQNRNKNNNNNTKKKTFTLACIRTLKNLFLLNLVWWQRSVNVIFWYEFGRPSSKVTVVWEIKSFYAHFLGNVSNNLDGN